MEPAAIAARLAHDFLAPNGLLVFFGSSSALSGILRPVVFFLHRDLCLMSVVGMPYAAGYGAAKAAIHQLVQSMAAKGSGLPDLANVIGILPGYSPQFCFHLCHLLLCSHAVPYDVFCFHSVSV